LLHDAIAATAPGRSDGRLGAGSIYLSNLVELVVDKSLAMNGPDAGQLTIKAFDHNPSEMKHVSWRFLSLEV
jgi:hypothetical protein